MKKLITKLQIAEGDVIPKGFGLTYCHHDGGVFYRWPINHIVAAGRWLWFRLRDNPYDNRPHSL